MRVVTADEFQGAILFERMRSRPELFCPFPFGLSSHFSSTSFQTPLVFWYQLGVPFSRGSVLSDVYSWCETWNPKTRQNRGGEFKLFLLHTGSNSKVENCDHYKGSVRHSPIIWRLIDISLCWGLARWRLYMTGFGMLKKGWLVFCKEY